jgi:hypothetical protein
MPVILLLGISKSLIKVKRIKLVFKPKIKKVYNVVVPGKILCSYSDVNSNLKGLTVV